MSRSLGCCFGNRLLSNVIRSGPLHSTHGKHINLCSNVQNFLSIGSDWSGNLRGDRQAAQVNQLGGQGRGVKSLQPHHFTGIHITHQIRRKMGCMCTITQDGLHGNDYLKLQTVATAGASKEDWGWKTCVRTQRMASFYS